LRRMRRANNASWIERARLAYPARRLVRFHMFVLIVALAQCVYLDRIGALGPGSGAALGAALSCLAGLLGALIVGLRLERHPGRGADGPTEAGISLFWLLLAPVLVPSLLMLVLIPARWGWPAVAVLALGAVLVTFHLGGGWLVVLRRLGHARPASPRLEAIV